jgi:5'-3' exonuclease
MKVLVDSDSLLYQAGFASQRKEYIVKHDGELIGQFDKKGLDSYLVRCCQSVYPCGDEFKFDIEIVEVTEPLALAIARLMVMVKDIEDATKGDEYVYVLTGGNFRYEIDPQYKANRKADKPLLYGFLKGWLLTSKPCVLTTAYEADDYLSIHSEGDVLLVHQDKDIDTVAGKHYNYRKKVFYELTELEAKRNYYKQVLMGDTSDNVIGLKGIGPVKAEKLLADCESEVEMFEVCETLYKEHGRTEDLIKNCRLLHLLRKEDEVWAPPR